MKSLRRIRLPTTAISSYFYRTPSTLFLPTTSNNFRSNIHTTPITPAKEPPLTTAQKLRKSVWGDSADPGPADPYKPLTEEEQERLEIARLEAEEEELKRAIEREGAESLAAVESVQSAGQDAVEEATLDETYAPEKDARSMIVVGTRGNYMAREWDPKHQVQSYLHTPLRNPTDITATVRRAVIEVYTQAVIGRKPSSACVNYTGPEYYTQQVTITRAPNGTDYKFDFKSPLVLEKIRGYAQNKHPRAKDVGDTNPASASVDEWMSLSLGGAGLKFAIFKRSMQLTGIQIPDSTLNQLSSVRQLVNAFVMTADKNFKSPKLIHELRSSPALKELSNVKMHTRRLDFIAKEKAIGRLATIKVFLAGRVKRRYRNRRFGMGGLGIQPWKSERQIYASVKEAE